MLRRRSLISSRPFLGSAISIALVAATIIVATGAWQLRRTRNEILEHAWDGVGVLSHTLAQHAARTIESVDLTLEDVAEQVRREGMTADDLTAFLSKRVARLGQLRNLVVVRADGSWLADGLSTPIPMSSAERKYFAWHRDHRDTELHIDELILSRTTGKMSIPLSRRLSNRDGSFAGVVVATLAPDYLDDIYKKVRKGENGAIAVWLEDGRLLDRYPPIAEPRRSTAAAAEMFDSSTHRLRGVSPFDGVERLVAFEHLDGFPMTVASTVSIDEALAGWRHDAWTEGLVIGGSSLLLVLLGFGLEAHRRRIAALLVLSQAADHRSRMLANNTSDMITHMALDGRRLYVSPAVRDLLGREPEELVGTHPSTAVHPDDALQMVAVLNHLATGVKDHAVNINRVRHRDGRWIWVEASLRLLRDPAGRPSTIVGAVRNIMDRQQAVEALRDSEARYRILAETTTDVITQLNLDGTRSYVSPTCRDLLGYEPAEMLGLSPAAQCHPDQAQAVKVLAERLIAGEMADDRALTSYRMRHKLGHWVWVEAALSLVRHGETGTPLSIICSLRDITERQRAAHHLERAKAAAEAAGRAKTDFVANMSHELRTPLTGILGLLDLLGRDPGLTKDQRRLIGLADEAGTALLSIVNDVLDFSKSEVGHLTLESVPFALDELVASCRDLVVEALRGKRVELRITGPSAGPQRYRGDPIRLRQVLLNLLLNAAKFTERGHIAFAVDARRAEGLLRVEVTDTGIGIPADDADILFERFAQADTSITRRFGGAGLGLAICKRLVVLMGGRIGAEARPEGGSRFYFEVPLDPIDEVEAPAAVTTPARSGPSGGTLLLAEDNATNAEIIAAMLAARGYEVRVVGDGAAAVDATALDPVPDLVLMDLQMPVMDGLTATAVIRAREAERGDRRLPIVALTANALAEDAARCRAGGMDAHVAKPVVWPELFATIDQFLGAAEQAARAAA